jgi:hypothetical protein
VGTVVDHNSVSVPTVCEFQNLIDPSFVLKIFKKKIKNLIFLKINFFKIYLQLHSYLSLQSKY